MNMPSDVVYMPSQKKRWSVASCSSQSGSAVPFRCLLITLSQIEDQRGVEYAPYISAHHYDSVYRSSPGYGESDLCRYSLPNRRSSRYLTSQESDEASILPKRTCFSIAFPLASYSVAPTMFDGNGNYPEELFNLSSTPESPVNSSLDYKASIQDDPDDLPPRRGSSRWHSSGLGQPAGLVAADDEAGRDEDPAQFAQLAEPPSRTVAGESYVAHPPPVTDEGTVVADAGRRWRRMRRWEIT